MKKIWNRYSYAIILILLSFSLALIFAQKSESTINEEFISITVEEGDSLWELSKAYADDHQLSSKQFINWVKKTNEIDDNINVGDSIIIPVKADNLFLASSGENE
ncbi:cell division suppressor protein YneA [Robertmurraya sp. Marseille-Q9965]